MIEIKDEKILDAFKDLFDVILTAIGEVDFIQENCQEEYFSFFIHKQIKNLSSIHVNMVFDIISKNDEW